ncbi:pathogenicity island protein [Staphylococcus epidermidis]|uniref:hypothetical protein n=1 Tax=Staphylococcus epidermidis TaxID=1282 RepID=UPI0003A5325A|nr:hypothetical protein [Staphylococcus epidermidis]KEI48055.1 pathogenicity island protein [Staphylococcus epidermidis UC7032]MBB1177114.1 pathogenicity island protein [Staphylococcus epidermidis]MBM0828339.1 pathogenicity island protein [Staphylococcus epidermidis]MCG1343818.1 pathogenicity island protein [Staphylococcus epidermidis]MDH9493580.1 pathogenicity island protein [Staphylococcus epidermidis]
MKINNLKLRNNTKNSVKYLYSLNGIAQIESIKNQDERNDFLASILLGLRQYSLTNYKITINLNTFIDQISLHYQVVKIRNKKNFTSLNQNQTAIISNIYTNLNNVTDKNHYIGQLIEYAYLKLIRQSNTVNKIGHEPKVYYKRTYLHGRGNYSNRLLDFVSIENWSKITLCECKANLQREFYYLSRNRNRSLKQKLQLMNHLKSKLIQCHATGNYGKYVTVDKVLVTAFIPRNQNSLPRAYQRNIPIITISQIANSFIGS